MGYGGVSFLIGLRRMFNMKRKSKEVSARPLFCCNILTPFSARLKTLATNWIKKASSSSKRSLVNSCFNRHAPPLVRSVRRWQDCATPQLTPVRAMTQKNTSAATLSILPFWTDCRIKGHLSKLGGTCLTNLEFFCQFWEKSIVKKSLSKNRNRDQRWKRYSQPFPSYLR